MSARARWRAWTQASLLIAAGRRLLFLADRADRKISDWVQGSRLLFAASWIAAVAGRAVSGSRLVRSMSRLVDVKWGGVRATSVVAGGVRNLCARVGRRRKDSRRPACFEHSEAGFSPAMAGSLVLGVALVEWALRATLERDLSPAAHGLRCWWVIVGLGCLRCGAWREMISSSLVCRMFGIRGVSGGRAGD